MPVKASCCYGEASFYSGLKTLERDAGESQGLCGNLKKSFSHRSPLRGRQVFRETGWSGAEQRYGRRAAGRSRWGEISIKQLTLKVKRVRMSSLPSSLWERDADVKLRPLLWQPEGSSCGSYLIEFRVEGFFHHWCFVLGFLLYVRLQVSDRKERGRKNHISLLCLSFTLGE